MWLPSYKTNLQVFQPSPRGQICHFITEVMTLLSVNAISQNLEDTDSPYYLTMNKIVKRLLKLLCEINKMTFHRVRIKMPHECFLVVHPYSNSKGKFKILISTILYINKFVVITNGIEYFRILHD